jgi:protein arginine kinase
MPQAPTHAESWKRMVLRSTPPAWLSPDAPYSDVVLSSRCRIMRNVHGFRFPHHASTEELVEVASLVIKAGKDAFEVHKRLTNSERDYLVGCRLVSPDFKSLEMGRSLLLDAARSCSVMINEEDHIRLQAVTAGWSVETARRIANQSLEHLGAQLEFVRDDRLGYLAASPYNAGEGRRLSAMFHLIGLANAKRLPSVLQALPARGITVRGLFGESSRAVGAFVQVSSSGGSQTEFIGACDYLLTEEQAARHEVARSVIDERTRKAIDFVIPSRTVSLADALRVLAWIRWAACADLPGFVNPRTVDAWLTTLEIHSAADETLAARERAAFLRKHLEELAL